MAKVTIKKDPEEYKPGKFGQFSNKGIALAAQKLNRYGLLLYLYLCDNKDGYVINVLSPTAISHAFGVTIDVAKGMTSAQKGYGELVREGFIKDDIFYPEGVPAEKPETKEEETNVKVINVTGGFKY